MIKKIFLTALLAMLIIFVLCSCIPKKQGEFFSLQQAYDQGLIGKNDLKSIAYYHNGGNSGIAVKYFVPNRMNPETLSEDITKAIKETKAYELRRNSLAGLSAKMAAIDDVDIANYYGTYNDCIAVIIVDAYTEYVDTAWEIEIDGVIFFYNDGNRIFIWKEL